MNGLQLLFVSTVFILAIYAFTGWGINWLNKKLAEYARRNDEEEEVR
jgi:hypothetical protein